LGATGLGPGALIAAPQQHAQHAQPASGGPQPALRWAAAEHPAGILRPGRERFVVVGACCILDRRPRTSRRHVGISTKEVFGGQLLAKAKSAELAAVFVAEAEHV